MKISTLKRPITPFVPNGAGNREAPAAEQFVVEINPMNVSEYESLRIATLDSVASADHAERTAVLRRAIIAARARPLKNFESDLERLKDESEGAFMVRSFEHSGDSAHSDVLDSIYLGITKASVLAEGAAKN